MENSFLRLPLQIERGYFARCDLDTSIRQNIDVAVVTAKGSLSHSPYYGSGILETAEYGMLPEDRRNELKSIVERCEPRLDARELQPTVFKSRPGEPAMTELSAAIRSEGRNFTHRVGI